MKAVIVECSNGAAVALCDDGTFRKLKNRGYCIGQELILQQKPSANRVVRKLSVCASLALVLLSFAGIGSYSYVSPYSFVSLDINPSIEYALNRYDKVISVSGINDEGQQIVSSIESDVKNQNITTAIGVTIRQLEKDNYIVEQEYNHVIVSVCSDNDTKAKAIASRVDTFSAEELQVCAIDTMTVSKEVKDSADSLGITPGKLALIHAVAETTADSDFDMAEWTGMTVSELETTIQQASSQPTNPVTGPAAVSVINSEYLSNALDEDTAQKEEASASDEQNENKGHTEESDTQTGSTSTDQNTEMINGSQTVTDDTAPKPNTTDPSTSADAAGTGSTAGDTNRNQTNSTPKDDSTDNGTVPDSTGNGTNNSNTGNGSTSNSSAPDQNNHVTVNGGNASGSTNNSAGQDTAAKPSEPEQNTGTSNDDVLTEDSSSKKDSFPLPGEENTEDSSNETEEPASEDNSTVNGEVQENQGTPGVSDSAEAGLGGLIGQIEGTESDYLTEDPAESVLDPSPADQMQAGEVSETPAETEQ